MTATTSDASGVATAEVREAARFGWALAELRGRLRTPRKDDARPRRPDHALVLAAERTQAEQLIELEALTRGIAAQLGLDRPLADFSYQPADAQGTAGSRLEILAKALSAARGETNADAERTAWQDITVFLDAWDHKIIDIMAVAPATSASYQLGRAYAEVRWAKDSNATRSPDDITSLRYLLGNKREQIVNRLMARVSSHYDATTLHVLKTSFGKWREWCASATEHELDTADDLLDEQGPIWHDLLAGDRVASDLFSPDDLIRAPGALAGVCRHLWPEILTAAVAAAALLGGAFELSTTAGKSVSGLLATVAGLLGTSLTVIVGRAHASAKGLFVHVREKVYLDLAARAGCVLPTKKRAPKRQRP